MEKDPEQEPHDILAAEEHAIPAEEPAVPHDRDPEPHDVLAAEEFAFPTADAQPSPGGGGSLPRVLGAAALAGALVLAWRRRARR